MNNILNIKSGCVYEIEHCGKRWPVLAERIIGSNVMVKIMNFDRIADRHIELYNTECDHCVIPCNELLIPSF